MGIPFGWWLVLWWAALQVGVCEFMLIPRHLASAGCHRSPSEWLFQGTRPPRAPTQSRGRQGIGHKGGGDFLFGILFLEA